MEMIRVGKKLAGYFMLWFTSIAALMLCLWASSVAFVRFSAWIETAPEWKAAAAFCLVITLVAATVLSLWDVYTDLLVEDGSVVAEQLSDASGNGVLGPGIR